MVGSEDQHEFGIEFLHEVACPRKLSVHLVRDLRRRVVQADQRRVRRSAEGKRHGHSVHRPSEPRCCVIYTSPLGIYTRDSNTRPLEVQRIPAGSSMPSSLPRSAATSWCSIGRSACCCRRSGTGTARFGSPQATATGPGAMTVDYCGCSICRRSSVRVPIRNSRPTTTENASKEASHPEPMISGSSSGRARRAARRELRRVRGGRHSCRDARIRSCPPCAAASGDS